MNEADIIRVYRGMSASEQSSLLAGLAGELTLCGRMTYVAGTEEVADPHRLRKLNELQHSLLGQLNRLLADDPHRYPDEIFAQMLLAGFNDLGIGNELIHAIEGVSRREQQIA